jgi:predicted site-specific integrase-resolvase
MKVPEAKSQKDDASPLSPQAIIFTRVSKNVQNYQRQIDDLTAYAVKQGWVVTGVISEKISGSKSNEDRGAIAQLLESARLGKFKKVLVSEVSRLGRSGYFGEVDHLIPWQIDQQISWRPEAINAVEAMSKLVNKNYNYR